MFRQTYQPAAVATDRGEQDPGAWRYDRLADHWVELLDRPKQPSQPPRVVVDAESPDPRQDNRSGRALPDPDREGSAFGLLVAESEAVMATSLALVSWEADPSALAVAGLRLHIRGKSSAAIHGGLLEYLGVDLMPPRQACDLLGDRAVQGDDEDTPGGLALLPGVEGVYEVKPGPGHRHRRVDPLGRKRVGHQSQTLYANLDAPAQRASNCSCAGVGSRESRNVVYRMAAGPYRTGATDLHRHLSRLSAPTTCQTPDQRRRTRIRA